MFYPPGPPCGPICCNERVESLLQEVKPEIQTLKEKLNTVSQSKSVQSSLLVHPLFVQVHDVCEESAVVEHDWCKKMHGQIEAHMPHG